MSPTLHHDPVDAALDRLFDLVAEHFGHERDGLDPDDDLFERLGIDSLQALDLLSRLEEVFDVEIPDWEVQDARTFRELARAIGGRLA